MNKPKHNPIDNRTRSAVIKIIIVDRGRYRRTVRDAGPTGRSAVTARAPVPSTVADLALSSAEDAIVVTGLPATARLAPRLP